MPRCQPLRSLHHVISSPPSPLPPPLLHLRTLCYSASPSPTPPSSPHFFEPPHKFISTSVRHLNASSRATSCCRWTCYSEIKLSPRRKLSSTPSSFSDSKTPGNSGGLGSGRGSGSDGEEELDREWEELDREWEYEVAEEKELQRQWLQRRQQILDSQQLKNTSQQKQQQQQQQQQQEEKQKRPRKTHTPTPISDAQYHLLADQYIDALVSRLEEIQELREDLDCEYSAGVLTISVPPNGTYVLNKQPPNKQIWLSSPVSGPKRYDYVAAATAPAAPDDGNGRAGKDEVDGTGKVEQGHSWIYLRDGSSLTKLLREELGVEVEGKYGEDDGNGRDR